LFFFVDLANPLGDKRTVDFGNGRAYVAPLVHFAEEVNRDAMLDWLVRDAGLDHNDERLRAELKDLEQLLQTGMRGGGFTPAAGASWSSVSASGGTSVTTPPWMLAGWAGFPSILVGRPSWLSTRRPVAAPPITAAVAK
jgi:hypothetical protein